MRKHNETNERPDCLKDCQRIEVPEWNSVEYRRIPPAPPAETKSRHLDWLSFLVKEVVTIFIHVLIVVAIH